MVWCGVVEVNRLTILRGGVCNEVQCGEKELERVPEEVILACLLAELQTCGEETKEGYPTRVIHLPTHISQTNWKVDIGR
jgi:hypothetical protein